MSGLERWSPWRTGLSVALTLVAAFLITEIAIGRIPGMPAGDRFDAWIAIVHCLMVGALVGAFLATRRQGRQSIEGLRQQFPDEDPASLRYAPFPLREQLAAAVVGMALLGILTPYLTTPFPWLPSTWTPEVYWHRALGPVLGLLLGATIYVGVRESLLVSRAAAGLKAVPLFEPERFAPLVRHGLANGLIAVVLTSVGALFLFAPGQIRAVGPIWAVILPVMIAGIVFPVWGARSRLRVEKEREMDWALQGIRAARAEPLDTRRLGELSSYHEVVRQAPEWPFTQSTWVRAGIFVLIPALAWLAAVVLEALLQATVFAA